MNVREVRGGLSGLPDPWLAAVKQVVAPGCVWPLSRTGGRLEPTVLAHRE